MTNEDYRHLINGAGVCVVCGALDELEIHHKNGDHSDNRSSNLEWRCHFHHQQVHRRRFPRFGKRDFHAQSNLSFRFNPK